MNITLPLNEIHRELEKQHLAGPTAKLNGCTVKQLADCCSLTNSLVSRIWNRFVILFTQGVWASDAAISKHLFLNVLWVNSKTADGLLKGNFEEKEKLNQVLEKVINVYNTLLNDNISYIDKCNFLDNNPFRYSLGVTLNNLTKTQNLINSEIPKEQFYSSAEGKLEWGRPKSYFNRIRPESFHGYFNYSLYPYKHFIESQTEISALDYVKKNIHSICTQQLHLHENSGSIECS